MTGTVLILGATGRFGWHTAGAFERAGWTVRRFDRATDSLLHSAIGADVIVNGWNPAYPDWNAQLADQTDQVIAAARASGATILAAGNLYVYGDGAPVALSRDTPHRATNPLGRLRIQTEAMYRAADLPVILLRAGDFIDTRPSGNWLDRIIAKRAAKGQLSWPGNPDVPHAWAYLPDLAQAAVALAERRADLARFEEVLFPGYTLSGRQIAEAMSRVLTRPMRLRRMSWLPLRLARPVWPMARHLVEMQYLWSMPHRIEDRHLSTIAPALSSTPVDEALAASLKHQVHPDKPVAGAGPDALTLGV